MIPALFAEDEEPVEAKPLDCHIVLVAKVAGRIERYRLTSYYPGKSAPCGWEEAGKEFIAPGQDVHAILEEARRRYLTVGGSHYHRDYQSVEAVPV